MDTPVPSRGTTVTKSYHDAATLFGAHALKLILVASIPAVIVFFLSLALQISFISTLTHFSTLTDVLVPNHISSVISLLLLGAIFLVQTIGIIALLYVVIKHETVTILDSFEHALGFFWRFCVVGVCAAGVGMIGLCIGYIPVFIISVIIGRISIDALSVTFNWVDYLASIIGAAIATYCIFSTYILLDTNCSIKTALQKSVRLVRGHFWPAAIKLVIFYSAALITIFVLQFVPIAGPALSLTIVSPFTVVYIYIVYQDLIASNPQ